VKLPGVTLDSGLTIDQHSCNYNVRVLRHISSVLTINAAKIMGDVSSCPVGIDVRFQKKNKKR